MQKFVLNYGNYLVRQEFTSNGKYLSYTKIEKLLHDDLVHLDYWDLGMANSAQQILRVLDKNWKSFFKAIKDWSKHKEKYTSRPKLPKYLKKDGYKEFALTTNQVNPKNGYVHFPKVLQGFTVKAKFAEKDSVKFKQARVIPRNDFIVVELIYVIDIDVKKTVEHKNIGSIDLDIDNFITFVDNIGNQPIIINGKGLKSKNKYFNELVAKHKSILDLNHNTGYSHRLYSITNKRNNFMNHFVHCASKYIVDLCLKRHITCIVIGKNQQWKTKSKMSKLVNQTFVQIPYNSFISKLKYKCETAGIEVIEVEESYTSGTSFLDNEPPVKENYDKSRRIKRGLFKSNKGLINADVNAACQIMKKVFTDAFRLGDRGWVEQPIRINIC